MRHHPAGTCTSLAICAALLGTLAAHAAEQTYPTRPIRIIVPYTPGGDTDTVARLIASKLPGALGEQAIVENRPGAGSLIGMQAMLNSRALGAFHLNDEEILVRHLHKTVAGYVEQGERREARA